MITEEKIDVVSGQTRGPGAASSGSAFKLLLRFGLGFVLVVALGSGGGPVTPSAGEVARQPEPAIQAVDKRPVEPPASVARTTPQNVSHLTFGIGDKLKLSFLERLDSSEDKWENLKRPTRPEQSFYLRTEISGDYAVQSDGTVSLPLLGTFLIADRSHAEVNADLTDAFQRVIGRAGFVNIVLAERPPVYVIGPVKQPGVYKYEPGMTALHAVALAGGFDRGQEDRWSLIEAVRESAKMEPSSRRLKQLMAEMAVLHAESEGRAVPTSNPLRALAGNLESESFITEAAARRSSAVKAQDEQQRLLSMTSEAAQRALQDLRASLEPLQQNIQMRKSRLDGIKTLNNLGQLNKIALVQAQSELSDVEERKLGVMNQIAEAERRVLLAKQQEVKFRTDKRGELDQEMAMRARQIDELAASLAASNGVVGLLKPLATLTGGAGAETNVDF
jgi:polysaccharide biosynthesis/export protein ExoF